jgi:hypothetical protein
VELPSNLFNGASIDNVIVAYNVELKLPQDASIFHGLKATSILLSDSNLNSLPEALFAKISGLETLHIQAPLKTIPAKVFAGLGESLRSL